MRRQVEDIRREGGEAVAAQCNVQADSAQEAAFAAHLRAWGRLDVAVLNAGIFEKGTCLTSSACCLACM